jgi:hypothetical protein
MLNEAAQRRSTRSETTEMNRVSCASGVTAERIGRSSEPNRGSGNVLILFGRYSDVP